MHPTDIAEFSCGFVYIWLPKRKNVVATSSNVSNFKKAAQATLIWWKQQTFTFVDVSNSSFISRFVYVFSWGRKGELIL